MTIRRSDTKGTLPLTANANRDLSAEASTSGPDNSGEIDHIQVNCEFLLDIKREI